MGKELVTILRLDGTEFKRNLGDTEKSLLKFSAVAAGLGVAVFAAAKHTAEFQDATIKAARSTGTAVEAYSALNHAAKMSGVSQELLNKSLRNLAAPSKQAEQSMQRLGVVTREADGKMKSSDGLLRSIADRMASLKSPADQASLAIQVFGAKGADMVNLLNEGTEGLDKFNEQAMLMGKIVTQEAAVAAGKFNDDLEVLTGSIDGVVNAVSTSVIAWVNQTGIIETATKAVQQATRWWNSLSAETKDAVISIAGIAVASGTMIGALIAAKTAIIAVAGAISLPIAAAALAVAALATLAFAIHKYWDQMQGPAKQLESTFDRLAMQVEKLAAPFIEFGGKIADAAADFFNFKRGANEAAGEVSVLGTVAKVVFAAVTTALDFIVTGWLLVGSSIRTSIEAVVAFGEAYGRVLAGDIRGAAKVAEEGFKTLRQNLADMTKESEEFAARTTEAWSNIVVHVDKKEIDTARDSVQNLDKELETVSNKKTKVHVDKTPLDRLTESFEKESQSWVDSVNVIGPAFQANALLGAMAISNLASKVASAAQTAMAGLSQLAQNAAETIRRQTEKTTHSLDVLSKLYSQQSQASIDAFQESERERLDVMKASEEAMLEQLRASEEEKLTTLATFQNERLLMMDQEYQAMKAQKEIEFEEFVAMERLKFEAQLLELDAFNLSKEEKRATELAMETNWKLYQEELERTHAEEMKMIGDDYITNRKGVEETDKAEKQVLQQESNAKIEAEQKASKKRVEDEEKRSKDKLEQMQKDKEKREKEHAKAIAFTKWTGEVAALEVTKRVQVAQTIASGIAGAAQAFSSLAPIPFIGPILGAAAAATILAASYQSARLIQSQFVLPPPELYMNDGGALKANILGGTQSGDVVPTMLTPGESVIDAPTTRNISRFVDKGMNHGGVTIVFHPGAIQNNGSMDEAAMDRLGTVLVYRLQREGFAN